MPKTAFALVILAALLLTARTSFAQGSQVSDAAAFLSRAAQVEDLRTANAPGFQLHAKISATVGKNVIPGEYSLTCAAPNRWREELVVADFHRLRVGTDGGYNQVRSWDYQPQIAFDLAKALDVPSLLRLLPEQVADPPKDRKVEGTRLSCIAVRSQKSVYEQLCFDPSNGILAHAEIGTDLRSTEEVVDWSSPIAFGDRRFPSKINIRRSGRFRADVTLTIERSNPTPELFSVPAGAEFWADCPSALPVQMLDFQPSGMGPGPGFAAAYVRVEADGTVSYARTLMSSSPSMGDAIRKAAEKAKFKPRMCGAVRVRDETVVDVVTMPQ